MGGGQSIKDNTTIVTTKFYSYQVWMSTNYSDESRGAFYKLCY
jgi:hypothetical protein